MALLDAKSSLMLLIFQSLSYFLASASTPTYPSCLEGNISWPADQITSSTSGVDSPEDCQVISLGKPSSSKIPEAITV